MIEVTIHWSTLAGDGVTAYLVDAQTVRAGEPYMSVFDQAAHKAAIETALREFYGNVAPPDGEATERTGFSITRIDLRTTPARVLKPCKETDEEWRDPESQRT